MSERAAWGFCIPIFIILNHCRDMARKRTLATCGKILILCNSIVREPSETTRKQHISRVRCKKEKKGEKKVMSISLHSNRISNEMILHATACDQTCQASKRFKILELNCMCIRRIKVPFYIIHRTSLRIRRNERMYL